MMSDKEIVYRYTPANEGDSYATFGIPARHLTVADVAELGGAALANLAAEGLKGKPMYTPVQKKEPVTEAVAPNKDEKR